VSVGDPAAVIDAAAAAAAAAGAVCFAHGRVGAYVGFSPHAAAAAVASSGATCAGRSTAAAAAGRSLPVKHIPVAGVLDGGAETAVAAVADIAAGCISFADIAVAAGIGSAPERSASAPFVVTEGGEESACLETGSERGIDPKYYSGSHRRIRFAQTEAAASAEEKGDQIHRDAVFQKKLAPGRK
jgi:hypothetical protein